MDANNDSEKVEKNKKQKLFKKENELTNLEKIF